MGSIVRSFLGEAALRLQRLLEVDAAVSPRFEAGERIQPVVVLGDGDRPGMGGVRGRRFSAGGGGVLAAGQSVCFRLDASAPGPLQLDRVSFGGSAASRVQVALNFGVAAGVTTSNSYIDRAIGIESVPGLFMIVPVATGGTVVGNLVVGTNTPGFIPLDVLLMPNMAIHFGVVSAITLDVWLLGRSF